MRSVWLMYHDVHDGAHRPDVPAGAAAYHVSRGRFAEHLQVIADSGRRVHSAGDCLAADVSAPDSVVLTFDDGWMGTFTQAWPLLAARGWSATVFVTRDFVGRRHFCDRAALREAADSGFEVGVHGVTHRMLSACTRAEVVSEFRDCKTYLEDLLGRPVRHASIPGGDMTTTVVDCAREAGVTSLANSCPGVNRSDSPPFDLRRLAIKAETASTTIGRYCQFRVTPEWARWTLMEAPRRILGMQRYSQLRRLILSPRGAKTAKVFEP